MKKQIASFLLAAAASAAFFAGCGPAPANTESPASAVPEKPISSSEMESTGFDTAAPVTVISRESGSGTRGAFIELFGVEEKAEDGTKTDRTTKEAVTSNNTEAVISSVTQDPYAIGYISLGSLNSTVKALKVDGVEATAENVKNGGYKAARPFHIATKGTPSPLAQDFISFILSKEGQDVVSKSYIAVRDDAQPYAGTKPEGRLVIAGSSSVAPVMEKLVEAYQTVNSAASIEIQSSDSTAGMTAAIDGTCDIGMASRELKESERADLTPTQIALDGIAIIVNLQNPLSDITSEQVNAIYTGTALTWADVSQ